MKICPSQSDKKKRLELDPEQLEQLVQRAEAGALQEGDGEIIRTLIETLMLLGSAVDQKAGTIRKLLRMLFGATSEKKDVILPNPEDKPAKPEKKKSKGHGRNSHEKYTGAKREEVKHPQLAPGSPCPLCLEGTLYRSASHTEIRIKGMAPLQGTVYELESLRCNLCQKVFTAPLPAEAGDDKYDASAAAMIGLLRYGAGMPSYRLAKLQENLGIPLSSSTQWDVSRTHTDQLLPVYNEFIREAAQGEVLYNDDTNGKILSLIKENKENLPKRKGIFTTGIVSQVDDKKIILFLTGRNHAGENIDKVLSEREEGKDPPIQKCDALSRNSSSLVITVLTLCLVHARRNFVAALQHIPEICTFVIETLAQVYRIDAEAKEQQLSPEQRLRLHQEQSGPLLETLCAFLWKKSRDRAVEPNSSTGKAIAYMLNHWEELTEFLRTANVPLDNNICEQALKMAILYRKNSLFFKTENGARTADIYMSLIYTCTQAGENPFDYLVALLENPEQVAAAPAAWMPWNFRATLAALAA